MQYQGGLRLLLAICFTIDLLHEYKQVTEIFLKSSDRGRNMGKDTEAYKSRFKIKKIAHRSRRFFHSLLFQSIIVVGNNGNIRIISGQDGDVSRYILLP